MNPGFNDCQNGLEMNVPNSTLNIEKSSRNFYVIVAKEMPTRTTSAHVVIGVDERNFETSTTKNTYPLHLNKERVSRQVTNDIVRMELSVESDSASSMTDCRKYNGKTNIAPFSSEHEGEARNPVESDTCYLLTHAIIVHNAVSNTLTASAASTHSTVYR